MSHKFLRARGDLTLWRMQRLCAGTKQKPLLKSECVRRYSDPMFCPVARQKWIQVSNKVIRQSRRAPHEALRELDWHVRRSTLPQRRRQVGSAIEIMQRFGNSNPNGGRPRL